MYEKGSPKLAEAGTSYGKLPVTNERLVGRKNKVEG